APLWTVSIEEQFYLTWPLVLRFVPTKRLVTASILLMLVGWGTRLFLVATGRQGTAIACNTFARLDGIAAGILLAAVLRHGAPGLRTGLRVLLAAAAVITIVAMQRYPLSPAVGSIVYFPTAAMATLALTVAALRGPEHTTFLGHPWLRYLGR